MLRHLQGKLSCPTPDLIGEGIFEGWPYVLMSYLEGESLASKWAALDLGEKMELCYSIGELLAELHSLPLTGLPDQSPVWSEFLTAQIASCKKTQASHGLEEHWLVQIDLFIASVPFEDNEWVLLHTEIMRDHLLVAQENQAWELTGLLDFEPAMIGDPDYEFASVGVFLTMGEPALLGSLLCGYHKKSLSSRWIEAFQKRAMAYTLLHRYSCLPWYFRNMPKK